MSLRGAGLARLGLGGNSLHLVESFALQGCRGLQGLILDDDGGHEDLFDGALDGGCHLWLS